MPRTRRLVLAAATAAAIGTFAPFGTNPARAGDKDCSDFKTQKKAQRFYKKHGGPRKDPHGLDSDRDGIACENNP